MYILTDVGDYNWNTWWYTQGLLLKSKIIDIEKTKEKRKRERER